MTSQTPRQRQRLSWWIKIPIGFTLLLLGVALTVLLAMRRAESNWRVLVSSLRSAGQPVTFEDLADAVGDLDSENTVAELLDSLTSELDELNDPTVNAEFDQGVLVFGLNAPYDDFFAGIPSYCVQPSNTYLLQKRELADQLSSASRLSPGCSFEVDPLGDFISPSYRTTIRAAGRLLRLDADLALLEGKTEYAVNCIIAELHIAAALDKAPSVILRLVQIATTSMALQGVENILRVGELQTQTLHDLQVEIADREDDSVRWALFGERALLINICDDLERGLVPTDMVGVYEHNAYLKWFPIRLLTCLNEKRGAELYGKLIEVADDPKELIARSISLNTEAQTLPKQFWLAKTLFNDLSRTMVLHTRVLAEIRCMQVVLAAEKFRLKEGAMPNSIGELIPEFLPSHPIDPFDESPLRFKQYDDGLAAYSVGENATDEGGAIVTVGDEKRPKDWGFRLLVPESRGIKITDDPPPKNESSD